MSAAVAGCESADRVTQSLPPPADVAEQLGVSQCVVIHQRLAAKPGRSLRVTLPIDGREHRIDLQPHDVRAHDYRVLVVKADGTVTPRRPGPVCTLRGRVRGRPGCTVAGAVLDGRLHLAVRLEDDRRCWMEPVRQPDVPEHTYAVFEDRHILPTGQVCRTPGAEGGPDEAGLDVPGRRASDGSVLVARLACDTDAAFVRAHGSPAKAEARINAIVNAVNLQYETQVGIRHAISTIVIRTENDPYTARDARELLCQFIGEWTANRRDVDRDVAHLFTGSSLRGGTIGIAADIGGTGLCVPDGGCSGGRFGTFGSYCLSQSEFSRSFACVTDLTAHELGHLWGAFHCACPDSTMNPAVTCTNTFSAGSIDAIVRYRDTRFCLEASPLASAAPGD